MLTPRRTRPWRCVLPAPLNWPSSNAMEDESAPASRGMVPAVHSHYPKAGEETTAERGPDPCVAYRLQASTILGNPSHRRASCDSEHVAKIAETARLLGRLPSLAWLSSLDQRREDGPELAKPAQADDWRPKRLVRTVLASIAESKVLGRQMEREAKRRRFFEAQAKAFLGDGLPGNWSIWKKHFGDFTPILDFIHALSYLFVAAKAVHDAARRCMEPVPGLDARCPARGGGAGPRGAAGLAGQARRPR